MLSIYDKEFIYNLALDPHDYSISYDHCKHITINRIIKDGCTPVAETKRPLDKEEEDYLNLIFEYLDYKDCVPNICKIFDVIETSYENNTYWVWYGIGNSKYSYELIEGEEILDILQYKLNKIHDKNQKIELNDCSTLLIELVKDCEMSTNDMIFAEEEIYHFTKKDIENLNQEIRNLELDDYVRFYEDDCPITIYGGIITKFMFE